MRKISLVYLFILISYWEDGTYPGLVVEKMLVLHPVAFILLIISFIYQEYAYGGGLRHLKYLFRNSRFWMEAS